MSIGTRLACLRGPVGVAAAVTLGAALLLPTLGAAQQPQQQPARPQGRPAQPAQPAQPPAQPAQPAPQPAAPGQPAAQGQAAAGPQVVQVKAEPSQPEWVKFCGKEPGSNVEVCSTTRDFVSDQGQPVLAVAIYDVRGGPQPQKMVRFLLPVGLFLPPGIRIAVDQGQPVSGRYAICIQNGCFAEVTGVKDDVLNSMKRGTNLNVSVQNPGGREVTFQIPLAGFGKSYDGNPIDPKILQEQQKKLQEELERRSDEMRKRLEQSNAGAAAGGAPPAAGAAPTLAAPPGAGAPARP